MRDFCLAIHSVTTSLPSSPSFRTSDWPSICESGIHSDLPSMTHWMALRLSRPLRTREPQGHPVRHRRQVAVDSALADTWPVRGAERRGRGQAGRDGVDRKAEVSHMTIAERSATNSFVVPGEPVPKKRARVVVVRNRAMAFTPKETVEFERRVASAAKAAGVQCHRRPAKLRVELLFYFSNLRHLEKD